MEANKKIFTEIIKRQIAILGPQIALSRVKNVPGIEVNENGDVISLNGDSQILLQQLINEFVELSGLIVKKTMESILASNPNNMVVVGQAPVLQIAYDVTKSAHPMELNQAPQSQNPINPQMTSSIHHDEPTAVNPSSADSDLTSANRDIEELNKMLNNKTG